MKYVSKKLNDKSDNEDDQKLIEKSQEEMDTDDNRDPEELENKNNDVDDDVVNDNEDLVDAKENKPKNIFNGKQARQRQSLGGGQKKIVLKANQSTKNKKPKTQKLVDEAIKDLNERAGSSSEAIRKFIMAKDPTLDEKRLKSQIKRYIKTCLIDGTMIQIKRSFKLTKKHTTKNKEIEKKKLKAKKEKQVEKKILKKEKQKQQNSEKNTKTVKETSIKTNKSNKKLKEKKRIEKTPKEGEVKTKDYKRAKEDKLAHKGKAKKITAKTEKVKPKGKLVRNSINLVVRLTPPRPKTLKKSKTTDTATKQTIVIKADDIPSTSAAAAMKLNRKGKRK